MIASSHDAAFDINANFFDKSRNPLGAVIRDGDVVNPPRDSSWPSIFLNDDGGTPRIVMPKKWPSYRAGVCIRNNGDLVFFATPQSRKLRITEIAKVARRDDVDGGLACRDAMLFDGGHSVNLYAEGDDRRISVEGDPVPVHIFATAHSDHDDAQTK